MGWAAKTSFLIGASGGQECASCLPPPPRPGWGRAPFNNLAPLPPTPVKDGVKFVLAFAQSKIVSGLRHHLVLTREGGGEEPRGTGINTGCCGFGG